MLVLKCGLVVFVMYCATVRCCITNSHIIRLREKATFVCTQPWNSYGGPSDHKKEMSKRAVMCILSMVIPEEGFGRKRSPFHVEKIPGPLSVSISEIQFDKLFAEQTTQVEIEYDQNAEGFIYATVLRVSAYQKRTDRPDSLQKRSLLAKDQFILEINDSGLCDSDNLCNFEGEYVSYNTKGEMRLKRTAMPKKAGQPQQKKKAQLPNPNKPPTLSKPAQPTSVKTTTTTTTKKPDKKATTTITPVAKKSDTHKSSNPVTSNKTNASPKNETKKAIQKPVNSTVDTTRTHIQTNASTSLNNITKTGGGKNDSRLARSLLLINLAYMTKSRLYVLRITIW